MTDSAGNLGLTLNYGPWFVFGFALSSISMSFNVSHRVSPSTTRACRAGCRLATATVITVSGIKEPHQSLRNDALALALLGGYWVSEFPKLFPFRK